MGSFATFGAAAHRFAPRVISVSIVDIGGGGAWVKPNVKRGFAPSGRR